MGNDPNTGSHSGVVAINPDNSAVSPISLKILLPGQAAQCDFWVSFYVFGDRDFRKETENKKLDEVLVSGANGFSETRSLILSEAIEGKNAMVLFFPFEMVRHLGVAYIDDIISCIRGFNANKIGLCFDNLIFSGQEYRQIILSVTNSILQNSIAAELVYFAGEKCYSELLNILLEVKEMNQLEELFIYH